MMKCRLLLPKTVWTLVLLWIIVCCCDKANAVLGVPECGVSCDPYVDQIPNISLLDVWAGVPSFAEGFKSQTHVSVASFAWIERAAAAVYVLQAIYNAAYSCLDFYNNEWTAWKFEWDLVVTAGPSCCPFSVSGKRLRQEDPRSSQGMSTAMLAVHLGALVLIMENVVNLVDEDPLHLLVSQMNEYLLENGMIAVGTWRLLDSSLGGGSGRERVFLRWEKEHMASCLPPIKSEPASVAPRPLREYLDEPHEVEH